METRLDDIADLFGIFHDGYFGSWTKAGTEFSFRIHIEYLAERIKPGFTTFDVVLSDVSQLQFVPWLRDLSAEKRVLSDPLEIFGGQPDILDGKVVDGLVEVTCQQDDMACEFCGGVLTFHARGMTVADEEGRRRSIEEVRAFSRGYWDDFSRDK